jgi:hypothetical protein
VTHGPVDAFLAELARRLRRQGEPGRRAVAEIGDHLRDLVAENRARGLDEHDAETAAVQRFGPARALARGLRSARRRPRSARSAVALAAAVACAGLAFAVARTNDPRIEIRLATSGRAQVVARAPSGCVARIQSSRTRAHQVWVVSVDPSTGRVLAWCHPAYAPSPTMRSLRDVLAYRFDWRYVQG